jgi:pimeloyl-ACP methyl ester carboxylesterase
MCLLQKSSALPRLIAALYLGLSAATAALSYFNTANAAENLQGPPVQAAPAAFRVQVIGKGEPVILIPGLASPGAVWDGTVGRICGNRQCHVLTLAGFAGTPAIDAPLLPAAEQQLSGYIAAHGLDKPAVIGHSMGGWLALKLAADHPRQVGRVVVVDALPALGAFQVPSLTGPQLEAMAAQMRDRMLQADDATYYAQARQSAATLVTGEAGVDRISGWMRESDRKAVATSMYQMLSHDLRPELARIEAPTLVLGAIGAFRNMAPRAAIEAAFRSQYDALKGVQVDLADNALHFIMYDDPEWLYARIGKFLN